MNDLIDRLRERANDDDRALYPATRALLREAADALEAARADAWLPIETAPHTGIAVLLWQPWKSGRNCTVIGHYANGWVDRQCEDMQPEPTHWRPLPEPPAIDAAMADAARGEGGV